MRALISAAGRCPAGLSACHPTGYGDGEVEAASHPRDPVLPIDETPVHVLDESGRAGTTKPYIRVSHVGPPAVVATRSGGPKETITDGENGLLVSTNDPQALPNALKKLQDNPELAAALATSGRQSAKARFSMETMLDHYKAVYDGLRFQAQR